MAIVNRTVTAIAVTVFVLAIESTSVFGQTFRERARQQSGTAGTVLNFTLPIASEPALMAASDVVVHGRVLDVQPRLSADQQCVLTEYTVNVIEVLKEARRGLPQVTGVGVPQDQTAHLS